MQTSTLHVTPRQALKLPSDAFRPTRSSIPLVDVVDSFDVFHTGQGSQGIMQRASKQDLDTVFGTTKDDEIVEQILTKGQIKASEGPDRFATKNDQRCVPVP